jgi:hypothetical protein
MAEPNDPTDDCFAPPKVSVEVSCMHCGEVYDSWQILWREDNSNPHFKGHWCCPTPGCDGVGFGFDILPTDPSWRTEDGSGEWDPSEDEDYDEAEDSFDDDDDEEEVVDGDADTDDSVLSWKSLLDDGEIDAAIVSEDPGHEVIWVKVEPPKAVGNSPRPPYRFHYGDMKYNMESGEFENDIPF